MRTHFLQWFPLMHPPHMDLQVKVSSCPVATLITLEIFYLLMHSPEMIDQSFLLSKLFATLITLKLCGVSSFMFWDVALIVSQMSVKIFGQSATPGTVNNC